MENSLWIVVVLSVAALAYVGQRAFGRRGQPEDLAKIRGWLAVLVAFLLVLSPLQTLGTLRSEIAAAELSDPGLFASAQWQALTLQLWAILSIASVLQVFGGLSLAFTRRRWAVAYAKAVLWIAGPVASIIIAVFVAPAPGVWVEILKSAIVAGIWTAYLTRSKRVAARYEATPDGLDAGAMAADDETRSGTST